MIVKLHKVLLLGAKETLDSFFELAQKAGFLEFIGMAHKKALELPDDAKTLLSAIRIAKRHEIHVHEAPSSPIDPVKIAERLLELQQMHDQFLEEKRCLSSEIARIGIFGDFSREDRQVIEWDAKRILQFFCLKSSIARELVLPPELIYVGTEYDLDYFVAVHKEAAQYPKMIEIIIDQPIGELKKRLHHVLDRLAQLEIDIRRFSNALGSLQEGLNDYLNRYHLQLAKHDAASHLNESLFAIEAWVPKDKMKSLVALISTLDVLMEEIAIEESDRIPTCMENRGAGKIGEDLVHVYDAPAHTDQDPSLWVLVFFTLFFSMIISDAGYGLIYLAIGLFFKWKFPSWSGRAKRFVKMVLIISTCCIIWGAMTASFFGIEIGPNNPYRKMSFLHTLAQKKAEYHFAMKDDVFEEYVKEYPQVASATDGHDFLVKASRVEGKSVNYEALVTFYDNILMEFSILVGVIHLSLSFFRYLRRNWSGLGWVIFMLGGYLFFPKVLDCTTIINFTGVVSKSFAFSLGEQMVYGGIGLAFIAALFQKKWGAFHEIMNVVQVFADVLSYLRLYALALAGMIMAYTFNQIGLSMNPFFGGVVILCGHLSNIVVSIMGGVIHGLRLNFLEWYHYSFEGGGKLFNPLRINRLK